MKQMFSEEEMKRYLSGASGSSREAEGVGLLARLARKRFELRMQGLFPSPSEASPPPPPDSAEPDWPRQSTVKLREILSSHPVLLRETALLCARRNRSLPWSAYPDIFERLDEEINNPYVSMHQQALGPLGRWICSLHPEYYLFGTLKDDWMTGSPPEQIAWLRQMRNLHPEKAQAQMTQWMGNKKADVRHIILDAIETAPKKGDSDILKSCIDDRSKKIRARALLLRLRMKDPSLETPWSQVIQIETGGLPRLMINQDALRALLESNGMQVDHKSSPDLFALCRNAPPKWWIHTSWKACTKAIQSHKQGDRLTAALARAGMYHGMDNLAFAAVQQVLMRCETSTVQAFKEKEFIEFLTPKVYKTLCERWLNREQDIADHPLLMHWMCHSDLFWSDEMTRLFFFRLASMVELETGPPMEQIPHKEWLHSAALHCNPDRTAIIRKILDEVFIPYRMQTPIGEMFELLEQRQQLRNIFSRIGKRN